MTTRVPSTSVDEEGAPASTTGEWWQLADRHLSTAEALKKAKQYPDAFYHAGYAVECALKAIICRDLFGGTWPSRQTFPEGYSHDLDRLLRLAGLKPRLMEARQRDEEFGMNWETVRKWRETTRYENLSAPRASAMILAVKQRRFGMLTWLRNQ